MCFSDFKWILNLADEINRDNVLSQPNPGENGNIVNIHTFPYMLPQDDTNMTATTCISQCQAYGYNAAGIEVGTQCCKPDTLL